MLFLTKGLQTQPNFYVQFQHPYSFAIKGLETALHITTFCI